MKKLLLILLCLPMIFSCGNKDKIKKLEDRIAKLENEIENEILDDGINKALQEELRKEWLLQQSKYNIKEKGLTDKERVEKFILRLDSIENGQPTPELKWEGQQEMEDAYNDSITGDYDIY